MRGGGEAMMLDPSNLAFEQMDAVGELILRVRRKVLARELARSIAFRAWTIVLFHVACIVPPHPLAVNAAPRYFADETQGKAWPKFCPTP